MSDKSRAKDYDRSPLRYAALGTEELAIFDPEPYGEEAFPLQVYRRTPRGQFLRVYARPGPVESAVLGVWLVITNAGKRVRLARSADGTDLVPTADEQLGAAKDRAAAAEARVRELEEQLARLRSQA